MQMNLFKWPVLEAEPDYITIFIKAYNFYLKTYEILY